MSTTVVNTNDIAIETTKTEIPNTMEEYFDSILSKAKRIPRTCSCVSGAYFFSGIVKEHFLTQYSRTWLLNNFPQRGSHIW